MKSGKKSSVKPSHSFTVVILLITLASIYHREALTSTKVSSEGSDAATVIAGLRNQVEFLMKLRIDYGAMYCEKYGIGPTGGFCLDTPSGPVVGGNDIWDTELCEGLGHLFSNQSVLDLGCGLGHYGRCLADMAEDIDWTGLDGGEGVEKVTNGAVKFVDLTIPQFLPKTYDWVMSLEVGEHIPDIYEDLFIGNLVRHAERGVVLSWAVNGQGGHHHVNTHDNEFIITRMKEEGFVYDTSESRILREKASVPWFKDTIMVFRRA